MNRHFIFYVRTHLNPDISPVYRLVEVQDHTEVRSWTGREAKRLKTVFMHKGETVFSHTLTNYGEQAHENEIA